MYHPAASSNSPMLRLPRGLSRDTRRCAMAGKIRDFHRCVTSYGPQNPFPPRALSDRRRVHRVMKFGGGGVISWRWVIWTSRRGALAPIPENICATSHKYPSMVRFLTLVPLSASALTQTRSESICIYWMGSETPDRSGSMVCQAQNSSHFIQEVVLACDQHVLTPYRCACRTSWK